MPVQLRPVVEAEHRARRQLDAAVRDLRAARLAAGLSQASLGRAIGCAHSRISEWERGRAAPKWRLWVRWAAVLGMDLRLGLYPAGPPLRDASQLRVLRRARQAAGSLWTWTTEVPVTPDPADRRAFDAVLTRDNVRIGLEAVTRLTDAQAQIRALTLKRSAAGLQRLVLVLADTRHNRAALVHGAPTIDAAFPLRTRAVLRALRGGRAPEADGVMLL